MKKIFTLQNKPWHQERSPCVSARAKNLGLGNVVHLYLQLYPFFQEIKFDLVEKKSYIDVSKKKCLEDKRGGSEWNNAIG